MDEVQRCEKGKHCEKILTERPPAIAKGRRFAPLKRSAGRAVQLWRWSTVEVYSCGAGAL